MDKIILFVTDDKSIIIDIFFYGDRLKEIIKIISSYKT